MSKLLLIMTVVIAVFSTTQAQANSEPKQPLMTPPQSGTAKSESRVLPQLPYQDIQSGSLFFKTQEGYRFRLSQQSDYQVTVTGMLARITLTQFFKNSSEEWAEAVYLFPLSEKAVVDGMEMIIGERKIIGEIREKKQAKQLYQQAKKEGKKASLLSQKRPNMFTSEVANIAPGETIKVTINILQPISFVEDEFSLRLPLTITPRFTPHNKPDEKLTEKTLEFNNGFEYASSVQDSNKPERQLSTGSIESDSDYQQATIEVTLSTGLALQSISSDNHRIFQSKTELHHNLAEEYKVTLASDYNEKVRLDADFVLRWKPKTSHVPQAAFFTSQDDDYQYGYVMLMPPGSQQVTPLPKEITFVIDISGSMGGVSIRQAKQALQYGLRNSLTPEDIFNIVAFESRAYVLNVPSQATPEFINDAVNMVDTLEAGGGTNMEEALKTAFNTISQDDENRFKQIVFITDGAVSNETQLFNLIEKELGETRLHTIGIGSAPNSYFMSEAAKAGKGTYRYISNINQVNQQMSQLFNDISRPVMQNVHLEWPSDNVEFYPKNVPDLYDGQPLLVSARWPEKESQALDTLTVKGQLAGQFWEQTLRLATGTSKESGIDKLWAREKVRELNQQYRRVGEEEKQTIKQDVLSLALHHQIMSPYTSFIAIEQKVSRPADQKLSSEKVKNLAPRGSQSATQAVPIANTSLGINSKMMLALYAMVICLLLSLVYCCYTYRSGGIRHENESLH